jgi:hypothetical protein
LTDPLAEGIRQVRAQHGYRAAWKLASSLVRAAESGRLPGRDGFDVARRAAAAFGFRRWGVESLLVRNVRAE